MTEEVRYNIDTQLVVFIRVTYALAFSPHDWRHQRKGRKLGKSPAAALFRIYLISKTTKHPQKNCLCLRNKATAANVNALALFLQLFIDADTTQSAIEKKKSFEKTTKQTAAAY